jgi:NAD(P)-dependent dehydrogenase (short-subunit alcohol dehydrogenase family)
MESVPHSPSDLSRIPEETIRRFGLDRVPFGREEISASNLMRLEGRRAIVTGGGGTGLGAAICHRLAEQGANVAVLDIADDVARTTAEALQNRWGVRALPLACDVGDADQTKAAVSAVTELWGGVDILVNNAGGSGSIGVDGMPISTSQTFPTMSVEAITGTLRVNLLGVILMSHAVLEPMLKIGHGRIINISSEGGKISLNNLAVYNAAKSGVIGFTRNLARDLGREGISVVCICPGQMIKQRHLDALDGITDTPRAARMERQLERITLGRLSVPDEVASMVAFLASDAGSYVHGTAVSVGGGMAD